MNAQGPHVRRHASTYAPYLFNSGVAQHPVAFERVAQIHDAPSLRLQPFRGVVGQFGQGFGVGNAHTNRDTGVF